MTKSTSQRILRAAERVLQDAGRNVRSAADRIADEVDEMMSTRAVGLGHAAGELAEGLAARSRKVAAKVRKEVKKHPATAGVIAGVGLALVGLGLVRRMGRA